MMNELAQRIAEALNEALDQRVATDYYVGHVERGLAAGGPEEPIIALTVDEVARIAARAARDDASVATAGGYDASVATAGGDDASAAVAAGDDQKE
ncbi:hypothetical protein [Paractinoplanes hotanensis]|uniref:Uncharacterized protein n=1 Tax=Paractinoplanes hotanensis TaxID=2906497 RepID=A0ABT0XWP4_9ACTN|nr:hypothetical protein [Actinoplanes hotanensis]MCM4077524.1 hypothetical protein [Actinoplanes hotanensis]